MKIIAATVAAFLLVGGGGAAWFVSTVSVQVEAQ